MGEAEAPAPPPVPQNPIKIFISGNSGNKEVRWSLQVEYTGCHLIYWEGNIGYIGGHSGRFLARAMPHSWIPAKNFLHFPLTLPVNIPTVIRFI